jgi:site-specific DNA-methyltransferase (adenine-specific)/modification methylase
MKPTPTFQKRIIGDCTLYLGASLELLAAGVFGKIGAIVSDPPYGINLENSGGHRAGEVAMISGRGVIHNDTKIIGDDMPFNPAPWIDAAPTHVNMKYGNENILIMLWGADHYMQRLPTGGTMLAWDKHIGRGSDNTFTDCEWAWVGRPRIKREVFRYLWKGINCQQTPLDLPPPGVKNDGKRFARVHISQKPVELLRWCIDKVRPLAGLPILDPYMGSGTTAIAALSLGHTFIGCEIDPTHFDVACRRIEAYYQKQGIPIN